MTERRCRCSTRFAWADSASTTPPRATGWDGAGSVETGIAGEDFLVRPLTNQLIGEEVVENTGA